MLMLMLCSVFVAKTSVEFQHIQAVLLIVIVVCWCGIFPWKSWKSSSNDCNSILHDTHKLRLDATYAKCCKLKYTYAVCGWLLFSNAKFSEFQKCFPFVCAFVCMECDTHTTWMCVWVCVLVYAYSVGTAMQTFGTHTAHNTDNRQKLLRYITSFNRNDAMRCMNIPHRWYIFKMFDAHFIHNYNVFFIVIDVHLIHVVHVYMDFQCQIVLNKIGQIQQQQQKFIYKLKLTLTIAVD